ncbi:MAG TPA: amino acid decarboxylase, partial [Anaerolineae bacterium]|nr:amino acid decarboxylase [Anaerolineae bacterium]
MTTQQLGDMNSEEFRKYGKQLIDWIADYLDYPDRYPVLSQVLPGDIKSKLPQQPPPSSEAMDKILNDFDTIILPGVTHW